MLKQLPLPNHLQSLIAGDLSSDPIAAQYIKNDIAENYIKPDEIADPIGDEEHSKVNGLVHRYPDRVLLKITDTCQVYCRFCFRKEMVGVGQGMLDADDIDQAIAYIKNTPTIHEVIFSGGDPLTLSNRRLGEVLDKISSIDHIHTVRFHTRAPFINPARIDADFVSMLCNLRQSVIMVLHVNHASELSADVTAMLKILSHSPIMLLSQSVLLKHVNDSEDCLEALFRALIKNNVKPYYLHHLDKAPGTSHFRVPLARGMEMMHALRARVSSPCLPSYVLEIPGGYGKVPVNESHVQWRDDHWQVKDLKGTIHRYDENL